MAAKTVVSSSPWLPQYVDIILEILQHFDHRKWDSERDGAEVERTATLSHFARTCKAFFSLAIPILWRRLRSLRPIFGVIRPFANVEGHPEYMSISLASLGIYPYLWPRLCMYAAYVMELDADEAECRLEPSIWCTMPHLTRGRPILPNLVHLRWCVMSTKCTALVHLVSPSVTRTVVRFSIPKGVLSLDEQLEWRFALWVVLSMALPRAPRLTHLSLSCSGFLSPGTLFPISKSRSLQSFQLCVDSKEPLTAAFDPVVFLNAEHLEDLDINFEPAPALPNNACKRGVNGFRSLRSLAMSHGPGNDPCYSNFASPVLTHLTIYRYRDATLTDFHATCAIWARHCPALQSFSCSLAPSLIGPLRLADALSPLLRVRDMRSFSLTFALDTQLIMLDADLVDVAQSWPRLTSLSLTASNTSREPSWDAEGPGFPALAAFRQCCPALERLWLPHLVLRTRDFSVHAGKHARREGEGEHGLREVVVRWIDADDWQLAAALVDRLFPCLDLDNRAALWGNVLGEDDEDEDEGGEEMCTFVPVSLPFDR